MKPIKKGATSKPIKKGATSKPIKRTTKRAMKTRKKTKEKKTKEKEKEKEKKKERASHKKRIFTKKQYNSGDGMLTAVWGPSMWHYLHTMSFNYPIKPSAQEKQKYREFVLNLQYTLPCKYCRMNLKNNFKQHPLQCCHMKNRETFSKYIYQLHEVVNKMLNKKSGLSYCDVRERYEHFRARCHEKNKTKTMKHIRESKHKKTRKKESGCTESLYGRKSKCIIHIVPNDKKCNTFNIDKKCIKKKL